MASLVHHHRLLLSLSSSPSLFFPSNTHSNPSLISLKPTFNQKPLIVRLALAESDSPKSIGPNNTQSLLEEVALSFDLPSDYFTQLPRDLRLDPKCPLHDLKLNLSEFSLRKHWLNDAAFDLSNGPVIDECGVELGELLLNISKAWEQADTSTSRALASQLPKMGSSLPPNAKSALGKRLLCSGRKFQSMGQYGEGELAKIAKVMITTGKSLAATQISENLVEPSKPESRMFKFGELQVAITSDQASIGAVIGFAFGALSWGLTQGIQSVPENSLQYANDNALLLAKSLRGALITIGYSSTVLSAFASVGLVLLARNLKSEEK